MLTALKNLFGLGEQPEYSEMIKNGGVIIDVRTKKEYTSGHIKGSKNIPLNSLSNNLKKLNKHQTVITCCASGMRSASAKSILQANGFTDVYNGGGWRNLQNKL
ncbi:rhodanese-like domain-containing protein [Salinimicrobium gaetbulicola]|uniref:Rhodanese-like domain-containing protein n=1 Tax=Salinimicrobium gaetbulicola TaxID=999702 RepID=A0ABW3ICA5_9FLAO